MIGRAKRSFNRCTPCVPESQACGYLHTEAGQQNQRTSAYPHLEYPQLRHVSQPSIDDHPRTYCTCCTVPRPPETRAASVSVRTADSAPAPARSPPMPAVFYAGVSVFLRRARKPRACRQSSRAPRATVPDRAAGRSISRCCSTTAPSSATIDDMHSRRRPCSSRRADRTRLLSSSTRNVTSPPLRNTADMMRVSATIHWK